MNHMWCGRVVHSVSNVTKEHEFKYVSIQIYPSIYCRQVIEIFNSPYKQLGLNDSLIIKKKTTHIKVFFHKRRHMGKSKFD